MVHQVTEKAHDYELEHDIADDDDAFYEFEGSTGDVLLIFFDSLFRNVHEADHKEYF